MTFRTAIAAAFITLISGCATTWNASEKAQLSAVTIAHPVIAKDAYQKPDATESPRMANGIPMATGGGLIPSLIGSAIDASVTSRQQHKYEATNACYFEALAKAMSAPPATEVETALRQGLAAHSFFSTRLTEKTGALFVTEIKKYGLQKPPGYKGENTPLRLRIIAKVTLKLPDGNSLWEAELTAVSSHSKTAREILADPEFVPSSMSEAAKDLCIQVTARLDEKLAGKG